jgi:hypothetical protein
MRAGLYFAFAAMLIAVPAFAQVDFSGEWAQLRHEDSSTNPEVGDRLGVPLNAAGRMRADALNVGIWSLPEWQCRPHPAPFFWRGTGETRITKVVDPVTRLTTAFRVERKRNFDQYIYLDGRPHPSEDAPHTWGGFSTGKWDGDMLTITTTHIKEGYLRMNGIPTSDRTTVTERWIRHDNYLFVVMSINDPVYLEEPFVVSGQFRLDLKLDLQITPCVVIDESPEERGRIPHYLPWANEYRTEFVDMYKIPAKALEDGAETMYPKYQQKLKAYAAGN